MNKKDNDYLLDDLYRLKKQWKELGYDVDSTITWKTPATFESISANYLSNLSVVANSNVPNAKLIYTLTKGKLPPGLTLLLDGSIS